MTQYNLQNFNLCLNHFQQYLSKCYGLSNDAIKEMKKVDRMLYLIMKKTRDEGAFQHKPLKEYNNHVLNLLKKQVIEEYQLVKGKKTNFTNLDREHNIYGNRAVKTMDINPMSTNVSTEKEQINKNFEHLINDRGIVKKAEPPPVLNSIPIDDKAIELEEFNKKFADIEANRQKHLQLELEIQQNKQEHNPVAFYEDLKNKVPSNVFINDEVNNIKNLQGSKEHEIIKEPKNFVKSEKYVTINGADRDFQRYPYRAMFQINMSSRNIRNITSIKFTKLIVPFNKQNVAIDKESEEFCFPKQKYYLQIPYVLLYINSLRGGYEGSSDAARLSTCMFVHDGTFSCENNRGFTLYKPLQDEELKFFPTPLSSLPNLNVSIRKPNGMLVNTGMDMFKIEKIDFKGKNEAGKIVNFLRIITHRFFPKNEFHIGDTIIFHDFMLSKPSELPLNVESIHFRMFNEFMNRVEGHEIVEVGNNPGYLLNEFYIFSPGIVDDNIGECIIDQKLVDTLYLAIENNNTGVESGSILNYSLQCAIAMKITTNRSDASILDVQNVF